MNMNYRVGLVISALSLSLYGCGGSNGGSSTPRATVDADYAAIVQTAIYGAPGSGDIEIIDLETSDWEAVSGFAPTASSGHDVMAYQENFYQLGKFGIDSLTKRSIENPMLVEWEYSTKETGSATANPYQLVFDGADKGYVVRYGSNESWEVDLNASTSDDFQTDLIDLSAYDDGDGTPEATAGVIIGDRLFVLMQRLDRLNGWEPGQAYIAVFNTATNSEIDLEIDPVFLGIPLETKNPGAITYVEGLGLLVQSSGNYYPQEFSGGIEVVSLSDYSTSIVVDDGGDYGQITNMAIVSATQGYFLAYQAYEDNDIYSFNPTTGSVSAEPVSGLVGVDIGVMAADPEGRVWVGVSDEADPRLVVIDPADDSVIDVVPTLMNPIGIAFTEE